MTTTINNRQVASTHSTSYQTDTRTSFDVAIATDTTFSLLSPNRGKRTDPTSYIVSILVWVFDTSHSHPDATALAVTAVLITSCDVVNESVSDVYSWVGFKMYCSHTIVVTVTVTVVDTTNSITMIPNARQG